MNSVQRKVYASRYQHFGIGNVNMLKIVEGKQCKINEKVQKNAGKMVYSALQI